MLCKPYQTNVNSSNVSELLDIVIIFLSTITTSWAYAKMLVGYAVIEATLGLYYPFFVTFPKKD